MSQPVPSSPADGLEVRVAAGLVRGVRQDGVLRWRGIPYAAAPVGDRRFRAPLPVPAWAGVRDASEWGQISPQSHKGQFRGAHPRIPQGEDCLNLNVIAPDERMRPGQRLQDALRPVMVFIHGGAYSVGSSRDVPWQGEGLVRRGGIVYVSINYRLGALGYLDFSRFTTPQHPFENNLGLRDQVAALRWVRDNIGAFGGDPDAVTLFGESSGANAVTTLMTVPSAAGLFHRAIAQSAPPNAVYPSELTSRWAASFVDSLIQSSEPGQYSNEEAARVLLTTDPAQLARAMTALSVRTPDLDPGTVLLCPVIDGDFLPERPLDAFRDGRAARIALIVGTNKREGSLFRGRIDILASTPARIRAVFTKTTTSAKRELTAQYPGLPALRAALDFGGDYSFWYPSIKVGERHSRYAPVYFYRFDAAPRLLRLMGLDATHGLELFPLFDRLDGWFGRGMTALGGRRTFQEIGMRMQDWWLGFVRDGVPAATWPRYEETTRQTLLIDQQDQIESDPNRLRRLAWKRFVPHV